MVIYWLRHLNYTAQSSIELAIDWFISDYQLISSIGIIGCSIVGLCNLGVILFNNNLLVELEMTS